MANDKMNELRLLSPDVILHVLLAILYLVLARKSWENLFKHQDIFYHLNE